MPTKPRHDEAYAARKERERARQAAQSRSGRDIGELPEVVDKRRKGRCRRNLKLFCQTYLPETFTLDWSPDHLVVLKKIQTAVLSGGLFSYAMPRGSGKSSLCEAAALWAKLYGHRLFTAIIGADKDHADGMLESIKLELETNERLSEDFPEVCYPIQCLETIANRAKGQLYRGKPTRMQWTQDHIVLPTIEGSPASGGVIRVAGITGRIRGMKHKRADGATIRPELVLVDDPQTDESAHSLKQCQTRERTLAGAILGLAGPGRKISGLMTVTVIVADDMADRILDRNNHPEWQGERMRMLYEFPTNTGLWDEYAELRAQGLRDGTGINKATSFYRKHRTAMDAGARVAWPVRFNEDELSAIQHAMNLKLQDEPAFWAEYQNEPLPEVEEATGALKPDLVMSRCNRVPRGVVPSGSSILTCFIDVQESVLYYVVCAWADDFTGAVIDYGTWPDQKRAYFTLRDLQYSFAREMPGAGLTAQVYAALEELTDHLCSREWRSEDGSVYKINRCLIDANEGKVTETVFNFCRRSRHSAVVMPSHGTGITASRRPLNEYQRKPGDRVGLNWRVPVPIRGRPVRHILWDVNFWKSFVAERFAVSVGDPGALTLYGDKPAAHRMLADHCASEYPVATEGRGRKVDEWKLRPNQENHDWDCLVGCAVAASREGAKLPTLDDGQVRRTKRVPISERLRQKRAERERQGR